MTDWLGYVCEINSVKFPSSNSRPNRVCFGRMNAESQARLYSREPSGPKLEVLGPKLERSEEVLTPLALQLLASLHRRFNPRRRQLPAARAKRQAEFDDGALPDFLRATEAVRAGNWRISPVPKDLEDRRVEITGPVDRKMIINALNAPVQAFMADFEDACSPTWGNVIRGQANLKDAVRRTITYEDEATGRVYRLAERTATLIVRPRGWHLPEKHLAVNGDTLSGALCDFTLFIANNYEALAARGTGPYFYLPKIESHLEARLWNDVFVAAEEALGIARGTIKATVLIETLPAAFEMDEILYELREARAGHDGTWIAHPGLAGIAREPFDAVMTGPNQLPVLRAEVNVTAKDLLSVPEGEITEAGLRNCIRVGVQYLEAWLRGNGCVPLYHLMEDAATAEICRAQLWQCLHHGARTSDRQPGTVERFDP